MSSLDRLLRIRKDLHKRVWSTLSLKVQLSYFEKFKGKNSYLEIYFGKFFKIIFIKELLSEDTFY